MAAPTRLERASIQLCANCFEGSANTGPCDLVNFSAKLGPTREVMVAIRIAGIKEHMEAQERLKALRASPSGIKERIIGGIKITDYDPARAPSLEEFLKQRKEPADQVSEQKASK
jgi:hypothetical protein